MITAQQGREIVSELSRQWKKAHRSGRPVNYMRLAALFVHFTGRVDQADVGQISMQLLDSRLPRDAIRSIIGLWTGELQKQKALDAFVTRALRSGGS
jgi:hypothetical protein